MTTKKQTKKHHRRPTRATTELVTRLQHLNTVDGLSFREIAVLDAFRGIPAGTLSSIVATGMVPGVWRERLCPYQPPARIAVRKDDMPSAARTLIANLDPERLAELADLLIHHAVVEVQKLEGLTEELSWLGTWEEDDEYLVHTCLTCGHEVIPVRPGKWQCDYCETMANFATGVTP